MEVNILEINIELHGEREIIETCPQEDIIISYQINTLETIEEQPIQVQPLNQEHVEPITQTLQDENKTTELRRFLRIGKSTISSVDIVYFQKFDFHVRLDNDPSLFLQAINGESYLSWYDAMTKEMDLSLKTKVVI